jgi:hypothetical protein
VASTTILRKMKEKPVEGYLKDRCEWRGGFCVKLNANWLIGIPDRLAVWKPRGKKYGRIAFVETKRPKGGKLSGAQKWWKNRLTKLGLEWHLICTKDEVDALIDG